MTTYLAVDIRLLVLLVDGRSNRVGTRLVGSVCGGWRKRHYGYNLAVVEVLLWVGYSSWVCVVVEEGREGIKDIVKRREGAARYLYWR